MRVTGDTHFASKVASLFRELPGHTKDIKTEWDLFK